MDDDRIEGKTKELEGEAQQAWGEAKDKGRELVISVNPTIVRETPKQARLWAYPTSSELMPQAPRKSSAPTQSSSTGEVLLPIALPVTITYGVGANMPFIAIQRYNRARLLALPSQRQRATPTPGAAPGRQPVER